MGVTTHEISSDVRKTERATHVGILTVVVAVLVPVLLWPGVASLVWWLQPRVELALVVYDQTVPDGTYLEHASLGLVLEYEKVPFATEESFVGAAPGGSPQGAWPTEAPDLVMLVDAYGVYLDETGNVSDQGINRITEALTETDADRVTNWSATGTFIYGEFNILGEPTESLASQDLQNLFGVTRTGWAGRYIEDLSAVSQRLIDLAGGNWSYTGQGIVLLTPGQGETAVLVLTGEDLEARFPIVEGTLPGSERNTKARWNGWFEVITARPGAEVDMKMRLPVNESGGSLLARHGVPTEWPFVVRNEKTLYLAADASENSIEFPLRKMSGSAAVMRSVPHTAQTEFFYRVYVPVVQWLLEAAGPEDGEH